MGGVVRGGTYRLHLDEAAAVEAVVDQCEMSLSELVTIAIDHHYGK